MKMLKTKKGKIKIYNPIKYSKSKNKDRGYSSYICYYKNQSIDIFGVYSPKAAIRLVKKLIKN